MGELGEFDELGGVRGGARGRAGRGGGRAAPASRRPTASLVLDRIRRHWPDLLRGLELAYGEPAPAASRPTPSPSPSPASPSARRELRLLDLRRLVDAGLVPAPAHARLRLLRRALRRHAAPASPSTSTTSPSSASPTCTSCRCSTRGRRRTTAATPSATTARSGPTSARWTTSRELATRAARARHLADARPRPQPRRPRARVGRAGAGRGAALPRLLPRVRRPRAARTRTSATPARGVPGLRARQLHLGRRARRLGLDDVQHLAVGPQLAQPRRVRRVRGPRALPREPGRRVPAAGRDRVPLEAAWAPPARTSPRCTR